jgi:outer membrane protein TolC
MKPILFPEALTKWLLVSFAFCTLTEAFSQKPDSLTCYLNLAVQNNPSVLQKRYEYQAALQRVPQVSALPDPQLDLGVFLRPMEIVGGNQVADIKLMQMFPWFGVLKNAKDERSLMAKASYESFRDIQLQVFYEVKNAWYESYQIQQNIRLSEKNIDLLKSMERLATVKFKAGQKNPNSSNSDSYTSKSIGSAAVGSSGMQSMGSSSDKDKESASVKTGTSMSGNAMSASSGLSAVYQIQLEIGELENTLALLKSQQSTATARFNSYLNRPAASPVSLPDTLIPVKTELLLSDTMFANHPMLGMLKYEQQSLDAKQKMIARMGYPMVGVGLNYSMITKNAMSTSSMNGQDMIMPMVSVSLPIYRKKYKAMQTETQWLKSATKQSYQATANALQTDFYEACQNYLDAQRRINLYENQSNLAKKTFDILVKSFSASGSGLIDILRIRQQLFDYEFKKVQAITDFNKAVAKLERLNSSAVYK